MLYNSCTGIYKFGNNTHPWRIRHRSNLTLQRGVTSTARPSENITCRGATSTARRVALSHSFDYISST